MQNHDRRSHAGSPPPAAPPHRWERPDVPRPGPREAPEGALDLDPPGDLLDTLDAPDLLHAADLLEILPQAARRDLLAGLGEAVR